MPNYRQINTIAREALDDMGNNAKARYPHAFPYANAMLCLRNLNENYGCDSASSVVAYFLANAGTWKGETARRIKAELKSMLNAYPA